MKRWLLVLALVLTSAACASFSTSPEAANERVRRLCYVQRNPEWVQIAPPENAQVYRDAWTEGAAGHAPFQSAYVTPRWPEDEFWFRDGAGHTRLCTGNPFYRKERCGAGSTVDFTEAPSGPVASNYQDPVCIT